MNCVSPVGKPNRTCRTRSGMGRQSTSMPSVMPCGERNVRCPERQEATMNDTTVELVRREVSKLLRVDNRSEFISPPCLKRKIRNPVYEGSTVSRCS
jgi:hypothetical protein